jgi:hypothetical protein
MVKSIAIDRGKPLSVPLPSGLCAAQQFQKPALILGQESRHSPQLVVRNGRELLLAHFEDIQPEIHGPAH